MQSPTITRTQNAIGGIAILLVSLSILSVLDASGKWLLSVGVSLFIVTWLRYLVHFILIMVLVVSRRELYRFKSRDLRYQILRGVIILVTTLTFFTTLSYLPQAQATTMIFLAPLIILAVAPWILGEPRRVSRWIAAALGFIGVLIVIRPGAGLPLVGVLFGLVTACLMSTQHLVTRKVAIDHPVTTMLWGGLIGALPLSAWVLFVILRGDLGFFDSVRDLSVWNWAIMLSLGLTGVVGHLLQAQAYRLAAASLLAPFMYLQIIAASALGWVVWGEFPDKTSWFGIGLICISGAGIASYEWYQSRAGSQASHATSRPA